MCVIASDGCDGIICVGAVGLSEEDCVCGVVGLRHIQDIWSARSCSRTGQDKTGNSVFIQKPHMLMWQSDTHRHQYSHLNLGKRVKMTITIR